MGQVVSSIPVVLSGPEAPGASPWKVKVNWVKRDLDEDGANLASYEISLSGRVEWQNEEPVPLIDDATVQETAEAIVACLAKELAHELRLALRAAQGSLPTCRGAFGP